MVSRIISDGAHVYYVDFSRRDSSCSHCGRRHGFNEGAHLDLRRSVFFSINVSSEDESDFFDENRRCN